MNEIEKLLNDKKSHMDNIEIPKELESRLYEALESTSTAKRKKRNWKQLLVLCFY